jgi:hypothetical protein
MPINISAVAMTINGVSGYDDDNGGVGVGVGG